MDELGSIFGYQETIGELRQKLYYTTMELESLRAQANEEINNKNEIEKQLLRHLKIVSKERDEARDQIQKLLNKFSFNYPILIQQSKANSSITGSNSFSETYSYQSPNDSFFDMVSSPDSGNLGYINQHRSTFVVDQGSVVIDKLIKGKKLPEKGKFVEAVREAGPLLNTILVAGLLPTWKNPPPVQGLRIPHVSIMPGPCLGQVDSKNSNVSSTGSPMHFINRTCSGGIEVSNFGLFDKRQRLQ